MRSIVFLLIFTVLLVHSCAEDPDSIELRALPNGYLCHGIDVSHHQGTIDWDEFFASADTNIRFIYIKATEGGNFKDNQWETNEKALSAFDVRYGSYHYFKPNLSAEKQARHFVRQTRNSLGSLPPVLDSEEDGSDDLVANMKVWLKYVERELGRRPIIYTSYNQYMEQFRGKFTGYKFWIAAYSEQKPHLDDPQVIHWQYSDNETVPGIKGPVDLNFSKQEL